MKNIYPVTGMHCASCANVISKKLAKVAGVTSARANYATETVELESASPVPIIILNKVITPLGYSLQSSHHQSSKESELDLLKKHVTISIPLVVTSLVMMIWESFFPYPDIVKTFFHHLLPIMATYMLFVIGFPYIKSIFRFAKHHVANMDTLIGSV